MVFVIAKVPGMQDLRLMTSKSGFPEKMDLSDSINLGSKKYVEFPKDIYQQRTWNRRAKDFEEAVPIIFNMQVFPTLLINIIFDYVTL